VAIKYLLLVLEVTGSCGS